MPIDTESITVTNTRTTADLQIMEPTSIRIWRYVLQPGTFDRGTHTRYRTDRTDRTDRPIATRFTHHAARIISQTHARKSKSSRNCDPRTSRPPSYPL